MSYEEIELLFKDLCSRIPYGVVYRWEGKEGEDDLPHFLNGMNEWMIFYIQNGNIKPYLRSMSSMTEEEFESLKQYSCLEYDQLDLAEFPNNHKCLDFYLSEVPSYTVILVFDWLNAHHFDYRGLITMGLALEAPKGMYETE